MPSYVTPKKNTAFVFTVSLPSIANTGKFQVNPTLATGDVKVIKDGGAPANIGTLPTVISSGAALEVSLTASEMNADNVDVLFSDAAGNEWGDVLASIQTTAQQIDDLASQASVDTIDTNVDAILVDTGTTIPAQITSEINDVQADIAALNDFNPATDTVANVTLVATTTTNTDMRGTDNALLAASYTAPDNASISAILTDTGTTLPADIAAVQATADAIEADTQDLQTQIGTDGAGLTNIPWNAAWDAEVQSEVTDALNAYDPPTKAELDAAVSPLATSSALATVDTNVDSILTDTGTTIPATLTSMSGATFNSSTDSLEAIRDRGDAAWTTGAGGTAPTVEEIRIEMDNNSTKLAAILADTGTTIPAQISGLNDFDPATDTVARVTLVDTTTANTDMRGTDNALLAASYTAPDNASITAILADTNELQSNQGDWATATGFATPTNVTDARDAVQADIAALNDISVANILDATIESSLSLAACIRLQNSAMLGKLSGGATTTNTFRNIGDTKDRITATVDTDGNRTAVTLDGS